MVRTDQTLVRAPEDFDEQAKAIWKHARNHLIDQGTWAATDAPLLESYVRSLTLARTARTEAGKRPFVEGSRGQTVAHPGVKMAADADRDAERYARALLLTPEARSRHQLTGGDNEEPFLDSLT